MSSRNPLRVTTPSFSARPTAEFALVGLLVDARLSIRPVIDRRPARALGEPATVGVFAADAGALRGLVEAAAALAAREARSGEGEEALRRVSGLLGAAAAARGAKGVEVKAILAADGVEADPAERARADLEHLEAREREIASWRPR